MNSVTRMVKEYDALRHTLTFTDCCALAVATVAKAPEILRTRRLTSLDAAMSRNVTVQYRNRRIVLPLADIDHMLADYKDNPTFGNVREMYAQDCYLQRLNFIPPIGTVLDLGANRGMFSLLALVALDADFVVGVEPTLKYEPVMQLLLEANHLTLQRVVRYNRLITSPSAERRDPAKNVSIETICREQGIDRLGMVKMDIEGWEKDLFNEPEWLERVDNIAMEVHPQFVSDLTMIPKALDDHGFRYLSTGQWGEPREVNQAMYVFASRTGALAA